jgi:hypothetical protein
MESQDIAIGIVVSVVLGVLLVLILKKIADSKWFMETLHIMCSKGDIWYVKRHLDKGSDVNAKDEDGVTPLHYAAEGGYNEIVELLIDKGANVNAKDENGATPQDLAIQFKEFETAALLRKHGGIHETIHSADVRDEDGSTHRNFVYWFLWFILGVMSLAIFIYIFVA